MLFTDNVRHVMIMIHFAQTRLWHGIVLLVCAEYKGREDSLDS